MHETSRWVSFNEDRSVVAGHVFTEGTCYSYQCTGNATKVMTFDLTSALRGGQTHGVGSQECDPGSPVVPNLVLGMDSRSEHADTRDCLVSDTLKRKFRKEE